MEYSITAKELQEIMELMLNGYECEKFEADETLYVKCTKGDMIKEYEFVRC